MLRRLLAIADHHHIDVQWRPLGEFTGGGACVWVGERPTIVLDPRLPRAAQVDVLAHELGHARDGVPLHDDQQQLLAKVLRPRREARADATAADLTVDLEELQRAVDTVHDLGGCITADELAAELGVPVRYARIAVERAYGHEVTRFRRAQRAGIV